MRDEGKGMKKFVIRIINALALSMLAISLCSCAGARPLNAERPRDEVFRTELKKEISTINIPIEVSTDELARVLNLTVRKELYKGSTKTKGLAADILRNGPITVSAADNYIYVNLPVAMSLSYGMFETTAIPLKLKFKIRASITPDWRLHTEIYITWG